MKSFSQALQAIGPRSEIDSRLSAPEERLGLEVQDVRQGGTLYGAFFSIDDVTRIPTRACLLKAMGFDTVPPRRAPLAWSWPVSTPCPQWCRITSYPT